MAKINGGFESSPMWLDVRDILGKAGSKTVYDYKGVVHTEKENIAVWDMNSIEIFRDYLNDIGEAVRITFKVGLGDYVKRIYPYRNNLEFTIKRTPLRESGSGKKKDAEISVTRYKAIFDTSKNPQVGISDLETHDHHTLNTVDFAEVYLELVDRSFEPLRIKTTGGSIQNTKMEDAIRCFLGHESSKVMINGKPAIDGIDIVPPDNKEVVSHIVIPHGTRVGLVPTILQNKVGGVYNRGLGTYFQTFNGKRIWFVYPTYDTERFDQKGRKIIFYAVPQERFPNLDRTWDKDGDVIRVLVTAQRKYHDTAELALMNGGSGFRMADARAFMKKPVVLTEEGPKASRANLNHEVVIKQRNDGLNYAPVDPGGPSSNLFLQRSEVLSRTLAQIDFVWENGDPNLIYPGMPCKYNYLSQGKIVSLKGTILFVHSFSTRVEKLNASAYREITRITIACQPQSKVPDLPTQGVVGEDRSV